MNKLKPCPFCGSKAKWVIEVSEMGDMLLTGYRLECSTCWCSPLPNNFHGDKKDAIKLWNTRTDTQKTDQ